MEAYEETRNAFAVPAGSYPAILRKVTMMRDKYNPDSEDIRFLFDIMSEDNTTVDYRARKVYSDTEDGSAELDNDLQAFCPQDKLEAMFDEDGGIALCQFEGKAVDLVIVTRKVKGYKVPFSEIIGIYPRGTQCPLTENEVANQAVEKNIIK